MLGTFVNAAAIVLGGCAGLLFRKFIHKGWQTSLNKALGVAIIVLAFNGIVASMFRTNADGSLASSGEMLLVVSLALGTLCGEVLGIDAALNKLTHKLEQTLKLGGFGQGFITASLIYCVGAMAIIGALNDGLRGDTSVLYVKSLLDGISSIILTAALGPGVLLSALPVLLYQGSLSLLADMLSQVLAGELLLQICAAGYCLVLCIGINFVLNAEIKVANMLPAILVPPLWHLILFLF